MKTINDFVRAKEGLKPILRETNLIPSEYFSAITRHKVYFKPENMQVTGSYKIRGAFHKINSMSEEQRKKGIVTSSAGNHAQGVAYAAQAKGAKAVIVMPTTTPLIKVKNTQKYGAEVVLHGDYYDEAYRHALELAEQHGYEFVHPFNDLTVATGQGTIGWEILQELPDADILLVPIGGGGLAAGVSTLAKMVNPGITVLGVEPKGAASVKASLAKGEVICLPKVDTIADGVAVQRPGDIVFPYIKANIDDILVVDDRELPDTFLAVMEHHKIIVENAGLISVAALSQIPGHGKKVVSILSGGNMDVINMASLMQHGLIDRGRIFTFSVLLPDRPGELLKVATLIAQERGNIVRLAHNQLVNINRNAAVELTVTLEANGHEHRQQILHALEKAGYDPQLCAPHCSFMD